MTAAIKATTGAPPTAAVVRTEYFIHEIWAQTPARSTRFGVLNQIVLVISWTQRTPFRLPALQVGGSRAFHLGHDDPRLRWRWLHRVSQEAKWTGGASPRLTGITVGLERSPSRRSFCLCGLLARADADASKLPPFCAQCDAGTDDNESQGRAKASGRDAVDTGADDCWCFVHSATFSDKLL